MNIERLKQQWLPLCQFKKISKKPQRFILLNYPLVVYKSKTQIIVLEDRCPHRGTPLSQGKLHDGLLQCPYHGWRFNAKGDCVAIPGLVKKTNLRNKCVKSYTTKVEYGLVFVCLKEHTSSLPIYKIPALFKDHFRYHCMEFIIQAEMLNAIENVLDATHTHYVHAGLLRLDKKRQMIKATLSTTPFSAEVCYEGESQQSGLISTLFERNRKTTIGRFHYPLVAELEYYGIAEINAAFTFFLSPISAKEHRIFLLISYPWHWFSSPIKKLLFMPFIKIALKQDRDILKKQKINDSFFPNATVKSTELDLLRPHIQRILENNAENHQKTLQMSI